MKNKKKVDKIDAPAFRVWLWNLYSEHYKHNELVDLVIEKMNRKDLRGEYEEYQYQQDELKEDSEAVIASEKVRFYEIITTFEYNDELKDFMFNKTLKQKQKYMKDKLNKELVGLEDEYNKKTIEEIRKDVVKKIDKLK